MSPPPPAVRARNLSKTFRDFWRRPRVEAVRSVSFDVPSGQVFGLLGPNGSGKSTTIKMILGLLFPSSGLLDVLDASPRSTAVKSRIGYLPEESFLYPHLTPLETLSFYAHLFRLPPPVARRRIDELLDMIGLSHARRRPVGEFSKGMARRIGLALGPRRFVPVVRKRAAFIDAMTRQTGMSAEEAASLVSHSLFAAEGGQAAAHHLLGREVTAIVCGSDLMALGAIRTIRQRGLRVPEDVSVVGYDDSRLIAFTDPPLTTVRQAVTAMGSAAVQALLELYLIDKALYELQYELNNRPDWAHIPIKGLQRILEGEK